MGSFNPKRQFKGENPLQDPILQQPTLEQDKYGFTVKLPKVRFSEKGKFSFLGTTFTPDSTGKARIGRLFRAAVLHITTHTLTPLPKENIAPNKSDSFTEAFAKERSPETYILARTFRRGIQTD